MGVFVSKGGTDAHVAVRFLDEETGSRLEVTGVGLAEERDGPTGLASSTSPTWKTGATREFLDE